MEGVDKLREFVSKGSRTQITTMPPIDLVTLGWRDLTMLIDEIEKEFKEQEVNHAFAYSQVYDFASGIYGQLLDFDKMEERQEEMAEHGWVKLPVDADGEYIRIGDEVEWCDSGETLTVEGIGSDVLFYIDGENAEWTAARNKRHHHAPTVEDVLHNFICDVEEDVRDEREIIAEYAAKLQLRSEV